MIAEPPFGKPQPARPRREDATAPSRLPSPPGDDATVPVPAGVDRRRFLALVSALGTLGPAALFSQQEEEPLVSKETVAQAVKLAGLEFSDEERELMLDGVNQTVASYEELRRVALENGVAPALRFNPLSAGQEVGQGGRGAKLSHGGPQTRPASDEDLAFTSVTDLSRLLRRGEITSVELTRLYLERLETYNPLLECVITLTRERALEQAERADREIQAGRYRGPLHGIPWGAKDLLSARGYLTTWGAMPFKDQVIDEDAAVVARLERAGAVLVAKLTLGALAWGDVWFGGKTRNPWNPAQGSSGSSAGSASATAAGLVGFAIGSETWGSIVSPCTRCGATGLRPTFGRVSRHGAMALSWSMDKLGPIARSVEDCALIFDAIYGPDGKDLTVIDAPFRWDPGLDVTHLKVGYIKSLFEAEPDEGQEETHQHDLAALKALESMGVRLVPVELPDLPVEPLSLILTAEASAAFDRLTRSGDDDQMVRQIEQAWPNVFRQGRLIPAVEYIQANRVRTLLLEEMARLWSGLDAYVVPSFGGNNLLLNNLTGEPAVVVPNGLRQDGTPTSISFIGKLFGEGPLLALAKAYQDATGFHRERPDLEAGWEIKEKAAAEEEDEG